MIMEVEDASQLRHPEGNSPCRLLHHQAPPLSHSSRASVVRLTRPTAAAVSIYTAKRPVKADTSDASSRLVISHEMSSRWLLGSTLPARLPNFPSMSPHEGRLRA